MTNECVEINGRTYHGTIVKVETDRTIIKSPSGALLGIPNNEDLYAYVQHGARHVFTTNGIERRMMIIERTFESLPDDLIRVIQ